MPVTFQSTLVAEFHVSFIKSHGNFLFGVIVGTEAGAAVSRSCCCIVRQALFLAIFLQLTPTQSWRNIEFMAKFLEFFVKILEFFVKILEFLSKSISFFVFVTYGPYGSQKYT